MDSTALVLCLFSLLCQAQGDVKEEPLYVKTGTDLLLDVGKPVTLKENEQMFWKFNRKVNVARLVDTNKKVHQNYMGRAELFPQNQSLLLKNVQKNDSGEYRAEFSGNKDIVLVKYQVTVLDPVSDVKLEVKQCGSNWPDLTLTCRTLDDLFSSIFICNKTTCSHEGGEPTLKVYLKSGSVTCHHSNQVSVTEDTKTIEELCKKDLIPPLLKGVIVALIILAIAAVAAVAYRRYRKKGLIFESHLSQVLPNKDNTDRGEITEKTRLQQIDENKSLELEPTNAAQGEPPNTPNSVTGTRSAAPIKPSGESEGQETTGRKNLESVRENEPVEPGPSNIAQGHMRPESWHIWTGEDVVLYFKKTVVLTNNDMELKVEVWQESTSLTNPPMGQGSRPWSSSKSFPQRWKSMTVK